MIFTVRTSSVCWCELRKQRADPTCELLLISASHYVSCYEHNIPTTWTELLRLGCNLGNVVLYFGSYSDWQTSNFSGIVHHVTTLLHCEHWLQSLPLLLEAWDRSPQSCEINSHFYTSGSLASKSLSFLNVFTVKCAKQAEDIYTFCSTT